MKYAVPDHSELLEARLLTQLRRPALRIPAPLTGAFLKVGFLGRLRVSRDGQLLPLPQSRMARGVLAFLMLNADFVHTRAALCERFLPDLPEPEARARLTKALSLIRGCFDAVELLFTNRDTVQLHPAVRLETDLTVMQQALQTSANLESCQEALKAYRGDFLADFDDEWVLEARGLYRDQYAALLERSMRDFRSQGDPERALELAQRLVRFDPLREDAHLEIMQIQLSNNQPRAVVKQFKRCQECLQEVSDKPGLEALALLRQAQLQLEGRSQASSAVLSGTELPLIAREAELRVLLERLEAARAGQGGVVILSGEPGIGKTHLLQEFMRQAAWRGVRHVSSKGSESASAAYESLRDLLTTALTPLRLERLSALLEPIWLEEVVRIAPKVALQSVTGLSNTESDGLKLREAISRTLLGLAELEPHLIVLEDLQWMDEATLEYLPLLAKRLQTNRLLLVVSLRSDEAFLNGALQKSLTALEALEARTIKLSRLGPEDTARLIRASLGTVRATSVLEASVHGNTEGNPLFVLETLRELHAVAALHLGKNGVWQLEPNRVESSVSLVQDLIRARLQRLPSQTRRVLSAAAILEANFNLETLAFLCDTPEAELLEQILPLVQNGFLGETPQGLQFTHDRTREVAYLEIPAAERSHLHGRAAEALERHEPQSFERLALHWERAGSWEKAIEYTARAAEHTKDFGSPSVTLAHCDHLEHLLEQHPLGDHRRTLQLQLNLLGHREHALWAKGRTDRIAEDLKKRELLAEESGDIHAGIALLQAKSMFLARAKGQFTEAVQQALQAIEIAKANGLYRRQADALFLLGQLQMQSKQLSEATETLQASLNLYQALPACEIRQVRALFQIALTFRGQNMVEAARKTIEKALNFNLHQNQPALMASLYRELGNLEFINKNYNDALEFMNVALESAKSVNDEYAISLCLESLNDFSEVLGNYGEALKLAYQRVTLSISRNDKLSLIRSQRSLSSILLTIGNFNLAEEEINKAMTIDATVGNSQRNDLICLKYNLYLEAYQFDKIDLGEIDKIVHQSKNNFLVSEALKIISKVKFERGEYQEALLVYLANMERFENRQDLTALRHAEISVCYFHLDDLEHALEYSQKAIDTLGQFKGYLSQKIHFYHHRILLHAARVSEAATALRAAHEIVQRQCATLPEANQRRDFLNNVAINREIVAAFGNLEPNAITRHETLRLPPITIASGSTLKHSDYVDVTWTVQHPDDQRFLSKAEHRQHRLERLLLEAAQQGAAPTVNDLASALGVSVPTIKRDLASARKRGDSLKTRGVRPTT